MISNEAFAARLLDLADEMWQIGKCKKAAIYYKAFVDFLGEWEPAWEATNKQRYPKNEEKEVL